ncbi:MAG: histidine phosphatase family protein [Polyangiales bacterium]
MSSSRRVAPCNPLYDQGMQVLIVRHGHAIDYDAAPDDGLRWLTSSGRIETAKLATHLRDQGHRWTAMYTSPLVRAVQTAEILARVQTEEQPVQTHWALSLDAGTTAQALSMLDDATDNDFIVLVSHMPKVRVLAAHLLGESNFPSFATAGACLIEIHNDRGTLKWMIEPNQLP